MACTTDLFDVTSSAHHGHVRAVHLAMRRLGLDALIASRPSRERDLVLVVVAARVLEPHSKLATTRWWHTTTLADEDDLYAAMDWLTARQSHIETKPASLQTRTTPYAATSC